MQFVWLGHGVKVDHPIVHNAQTLLRTFQYASVTSRNSSGAPSMLSFCCVKMSLASPLDAAERLRAIRVKLITLGALVLGAQGQRWWFTLTGSCSAGRCGWEEPRERPRKDVLLKGIAIAMVALRV